MKFVKGQSDFGGFFAVFGGIDMPLKKGIPEMAVSWVEMGGVASGEWQVIEALGMAMLHR
jgi:hypothetical protein